MHKLAYLIRFFNIIYVINHIICIKTLALEAETAITYPPTQEKELVTCLVAKKYREPVCKQQ